MPGIVGFKKSGFDIKDITVLEKMQNLITYDQNLKLGLFHDKKGLFATASTLEKNRSPCFYIKAGAYMWLDGEIYSESPESLLEIITNKNFDNQTKIDFLKKIDGIYSVAIYDESDNKVYLINDRYGLKNIFWILSNDCFAWASETKAFLPLENYSPKIKKTSLDEFLVLGHFLEDNTWFENVNMTPSGSISTFDLNTFTHTVERYWWWDNIKKLHDNYSEDELVEELGRLFKNAVTKRCSNGKNHCVSLSGGLDSRAILASISKGNVNTCTLTFGSKKSLDSKIASRSSLVENIKHYIFDITADNWLPPRLKGVWATEGQENLIHMHGIECLDFFHDISDVVFDGFAGCSTIGGSYIKNENYFKMPFNKELLSDYYGCNAQVFKNGLEKYETLDTVEYHILQNRCRRFIYEGIRHSNTKLLIRIPFYDNDFIDFLYSLPNHLRYNSYIYKKVLLHHFPDYYENIPWQATGVSINKTPFKLNTLYKKSVNKVKRLSPRLGFSYPIIDNYVNYAKWIKSGRYHNFIKNLLFDKNALYHEYIDFNEVKNLWNLHLKGFNNTEKIGRYLTFEIFLQQIFNNKYLDWSD